MFSKTASRKHAPRRILASLLSLALASVLALSVCAATVTSNNGTGETPVHLSSTSDGTLNGDPAATAFSVTVPTSLPIAVAPDGTVTTASDAKIINHSYGAVRVKSVTLASANNWHLAAFGNKSVFAAEKVDSNKLGFQLRIGSGSALSTDASNANTQTLLSAPAAGCYLTGSGDAAGSVAAVVYDAIVTPLSSPVTGANVANAVFVIEWDT